jgi:hypothetical protein
MHKLKSAAAVVVPVKQLAILRQLNHDLTYAECLMQHDNSNNVLY